MIQRTMDRLSSLPALTIAALTLIAGGCSEGPDAPSFESFAFERPGTGGCVPEPCSERLTVDRFGRTTWRHQGINAAAGLTPSDLEGFAWFVSSSDFLAAVSERRGCEREVRDGTSPWIEIEIAGRDVLRRDVGTCNGGAWINLDYWLALIQSRFPRVGEPPSKDGG